MKDYNKGKRNKMKKRNLAALTAALIIVLAVLFGGSGLAGTADTGSELFTDRDLKQEADLEGAATLTVTDGATVTVSGEGVYILTGSAKNAQVVIDAGEGPIVMINPKILEQDGEQVGAEGCLSVPEKAGQVTRPMHGKAQALDIDMNPFEIEGEELLARAICHELDHLDGVMYVTKVEGELYDVLPEEESEEDEEAPEGEEETESEAAESEAAAKAAESEAVPEA